MEQCLRADERTVDRENGATKLCGASAGWSGRSSAHLEQRLVGRPGWIAMCLWCSCSISSALSRCLRLLTSRDLKIPDLTSLTTMMARSRRSEGRSIPRLGRSKSRLWRDARECGSAPVHLNSSIDSLMPHDPATDTAARPGQRPDIPFSFAQKRHLILGSAHPSPLSAHRGSPGNGHFTKENDWLEQRYGPDSNVDWTSLSSC